MTTRGQLLVEERIEGSPQLERWVEIRSERTDRQRAPRLISEAIASGLEVHNFNYEPWSPIVVRARGSAEGIADLREHLAKLEPPPEVVVWSPEPDQEHFGPGVYDRAIRSFFEASTRVAHETTMLTTSDLRLEWGHLLSKLTHCFLNAQGLDTPDEVDFAKEFLRNRKKQARRDYGRFWRRYRKCG